MKDKNLQKLEVGQTVRFSLNLESWTGEVLSVDNQQEEATFEVTERETGVGLRERKNKVECARYITII